MIKCLFTLTLFVLGVGTANAWAISVKNIQKAAAAGVVSAALALGAAPLVSHAASPFDGSYSDPKHPNCLRIIKVTSDGTTADISGTDGTPGCPPDGSGKPWNLQGKIEGNDILVDFTPKGGPANLKGILRNDKIEWPDGNAWTNIKTPVRKIATW